MLRDFTWTEKYEEVMSDEHPPRARNKFVEIVAAAEGYLIITHVKKLKNQRGSRSEYAFSKAVITGL